MKNSKQKDDLYRFVKDFIREHKIACSESIFQSDELQLGAPEFMEKCVKIVGYPHERDLNE